MTDWTPIAVLPNLHAKKALEGEFMALAPAHDERVQTFCKANPKFETFMSRFTNAFGQKLNPVIMLARNDVTQKLIGTDAYQSFRDVVASSVVPYTRSLSIVYRSSTHIWYSNSFELYPWTFNAEKEYLFLSTPALQGLHVVDNFCGQSSPALSEMELRDIDEPLLVALLARWKRYYIGNHRRWKDRALFRALNMAYHASQLPSGAGTTLYDLGRNIGLWVSAFEILVHPRNDKADILKVYPLLELVPYTDPKIKRRVYTPYTPRAKKPWPRRNLSCWLYSKLYNARNNFLHGNPIKKQLLNPSSSKVGLFAIGPLLFRLALTTFLNLKTEKPKPGKFRIDSQNIIERALLRTRK